MTEFLVGLAVGALAMLPTVLTFRYLLVRKDEELAEVLARGRELMTENHSLHLQLAAPTSVERAGIAALLNRPDPVEEDPAGRWLHSDDGLLSTFVPDSLR